MCGIWALIGDTQNDMSPYWYQYFMRMKHRGPMYSCFQTYPDALVGFHRLSIMDPSFQSNQPYVIENLVFICNGEIYNYQELNTKYKLGLTSKSDCQVIPLLYLRNDFNTFLSIMQEVNGEFAFVLLEFDDNNRLKYVVAGRDQVGVRPLYYGEHGQQIIFSSEIKACRLFDGPVREFPPGKIYSIDYRDRNEPPVLHDFSTIYRVVPLVKTTMHSQYQILSGLRRTITEAVRCRLDADQPMAFLLSGGIDSSLVAAIATTILNRGREYRASVWTPVRTFCCGIRCRKDGAREGEGEGSDLKYARMVADWIHSDHTEVLFTEEEALAAIDDVIYTTETWDTTTIRASVGQYLVSKFIAEKTNSKVLFVGEGPDEVCSSYLFNWYAPDPDKLHETAVEYVKNIHYYDMKRADRCIARWGLEARVALLDPEFIKTYWSIPSAWRDPKYKGIEKYWLREAFSEDELLPNEVLWRKKEAFSDGISSQENSWFKIVQDHIKTKFGLDEREYYQNKFCEYFGERRLDIIPGYWQPKWDASGNEVTEYVDPSARTLSVYNEASV